MISHERLAELSTKDGTIAIPSLDGSINEIDLAKVPFDGGVTVSGRIDSTSEAGKALTEHFKATSSEFRERLAQAEAKAAQIRKDRGLE